MQNAIAGHVGRSTWTPAALLPADDISNGFDNIASVLKVSPSFLDQYITAARAVSRQAIAHPPPTEPGEGESARRARRRSRSDLPLGTQRRNRGRASVPLRWRLRVHASPAPDPILHLDGLPNRSPAASCTSRPACIKSALTARAHSFAESEGMLQSFIPGRAYPAMASLPAAGAAADAAAGGPGIEITGPYQSHRHSRSKPPSRAADFRLPARPAESEEASCAAAHSFASIAHRAFRRPVTRQGSRRAPGLLQGRPRDRQFRRRHSERHHRDSGQPQVPVSRRAAAAESRARHQSTASAIWNSPRACRSSCGAPFPTTSCSASPSRAS